MVKFKRAALQRFVNLREKSAPPVFVGRNSLVKEILTVARTTGEERVGIPGNTMVVQGAPGAGKSSLLSYLTLQNTKDNAPKTLHISSIELEEQLSDVLLAIAALGRTPKSKLKHLALKTAKSVGSLAILDSIGLADITAVNVTALFRSHEIETIGSLHKAFPVDQWDAPVIVAVDEAQNLPRGRESRQARFLRSLHEAVTKLPLSLVLAGLGDTQSRLRAMGLTQGVQACALGCFTADETQILMRRWCAYFGIEVGSQQNQIDVLITPTDGWPRHVHWAQQALAETLLELDVDGRLDQIDDWTRIYDRSNRLRYAYYDTQFSEEMTASCKLVGRVMLAVDKANSDGAGKTFGEIKDLVTMYQGHQPGSEWMMPGGYDENLFVTHLIHCGVLQRRSMNPDDHVMTCPIPSFQSYIIKRGGFDVPRDFAS